jgi:hypothetical protein
VILAQAPITTQVDRYHPVEYRQYETRRVQLDPVIVIYSQWVIGPIQAVLRLQQLPVGWDRGGSQPPNETAVMTAIQIVNNVAKLGYDDFPAPHVFPVPGGGVQLEWQRGDRQLEIEVLPTGAAEFVKGIQGEPLEEGDFPMWPPTQAKQVFAWLISEE